MSLITTNFMVTIINMIIIIVKWLVAVWLGLVYKNTHSVLRKDDGYLLSGQQRI